MSSRCLLGSTPKLRLCDVASSEIVRGFLNFNPATGSPPHGVVPGRFGFQKFELRRRPDVKSAIWASLDEHGQINPVLLWARWGYIWCMYGGTRVLWAVDRGRDVRAIVVDYDNRFKGSKSVSKKSLCDYFVDPPIGMKPRQFEWRDGVDFVLAERDQWWR